MWMKAGNGLFVHSCVEHGAFMKNQPFNGIKIGNVSMRSAVADWWRAPVDVPAADHAHMQVGVLHDTIPPGARSLNVNPTCDSSGLDWKSTVAMAKHLSFRHVGVLARSQTPARVPRCSSRYACEPLAEV